MKYFAPLCFAVILLASCGNDGKAPESDSLKGDTVAMQYFGDTITPDGAIPASELKAKVGNAASMNLKVEGKLESCCQKKGCWSELMLNDSETIHVTFKDYGFFVPKDAAGKTMIMEGVAKYDTTNVEMIKHLASE